MEQTVHDWRCGKTKIWIKNELRSAASLDEGYGQNRLEAMVYMAWYGGGGGVMVMVAQCHYEINVVFFSCVYLSVCRSLCSWRTCPNGKYKMEKLMKTFKIRWKRYNWFVPSVLRNSGKKDAAAKRFSMKNFQQRYFCRWFMILAAHHFIRFYCFAIGTFEFWENRASLNLRMSRSFNSAFVFFPATSIENHLNFFWIYCVFFLVFGMMQNRSSICPSLANTQMQECV